MKKVIALILTLAMLFCLAACGNTNTDVDESTPPQDSSSVENVVDAVIGAEETSLVGKKIGFSNVDSSFEFFANMDRDFEAAFTELGMEYTSMSAAFNPVTQAESIENFITMGMDYIVLFVIDAPSATDVLIRAKESGCYVIVIGTILDNPAAYDICISINQYDAGYNCAKMASDWIDATFPDAKDGEIQVVTFGSTATEDSTTRSNALAEIAEINPKVTVLNTYMIASGEDGNTKGQEFAEMAFMEYPDLDCIITYGTDLGAAANEVAMRQEKLNRDEFAVFTVDTDDYVLEKLAASANNESVLRGTITLGDGTAYTCVQMLTGEWLNRVVDGIYHEACNPITIDNLDEYINSKK